MQSYNTECMRNVLCLDGNEGKCGGRPTVEFRDLKLPPPQQRTSKSNTTQPIGLQADGSPCDKVT